MIKKVFGRKLSRSRPAREALFSQLARALILNGKIVTTRAKAKAVQGDLDRFVTLAKKADLNSRRKVLASLDNNKDTVKILFNKIAPIFSGRNSGYTRIITLPTRKGDNAKMVRIEWTDKIVQSDKKEEKGAKSENKKVVKKPVK